MNKKEKERRSEAASILGTIGGQSRKKKIGSKGYKAMAKKRWNKNKSSKK